MQHVLDAVFTTRLALSVLDASAPGSPAARNLARAAVSRTGESDDGYALRDLLAHPATRSVLDAGRTAVLEQDLAACALGSGALPENTCRQLDAAVERASQVLENAPFDPGTPGGGPLERHQSDPRVSDSRPHPSNAQRALKR
ncbi:hypothetical protein ACFV6F_04470 [Kitasatospora phosalacinea]|uniref:hypothetical protein n=1 Tax=Kitasatospora phosalacinea TaxID=2065 RepID=UPI003652AF1E